MARCSACGACQAGVEEHCPFCGHDSSFQRLQRTERRIGWFWKAVVTLLVGLVLLVLLTFPRWIQ